MSHPDLVGALTFSPDGKYIASGGDDGTVRLWDAVTGREVKRLTHDYGVTSLSFSADGKYIVTASNCRTWSCTKGSIHIWEVDSGNEIVNMTFDSLVPSVAFSRDGKNILSAGSDGTVRLWAWQSGDMIENACALLLRNPTPDEWSLYFPGEEYGKICDRWPKHPDYYYGIAADILSNSNGAPDLQKAVDGVKIEMEKDPSIADPALESSQLVGRIVQAQVDKDVRIGQWQLAIDLLGQAQDLRLMISDASLLNEVCWYGSLRGFASQVLPSCEQAVALAPDNADIRDSRGLARALNDNYSGAIADFQFFIDHTARTGNEAQLRQTWIRDLKAGINPFTPEVLEGLK